ncbi:unnamed protein product [Diabrotica balteata]|uniref:Uncharacterized protein n=1 Tax=Diabrotica balteata TaxID=107213 RepID=A0A9N9X7N0_DIABA|nr:unnamed protein product [Diabrotica balteata]
MEAGDYFLLLTNSFMYFGEAFLLLGINFRKSYAGVSFQTQVLHLIAALSNILSLFEAPIKLELVVFIALCHSLISVFPIFIFYRYYSTYQNQHDTIIPYVLFPSTYILAGFTSEDDYFKEVGRLLNVCLPLVADLPQIFMSAHLQQLPTHVLYYFIGVFLSKVSTVIYAINNHLLQNGYFLATLVDLVFFVAALVFLSLCGVEIVKSVKIHQEDNAERKVVYVSGKGGEDSSLMLEEQETRV